MHLLPFLLALAAAEAPAQAPPAKWSECFEIVAVRKINETIDAPQKTGAGQSAAAIDSGVQIGDGVDISLKRKETTPGCNDSQLVPNEMAVFVDGVELPHAAKPALIPTTKDQFTARIFLDRSLDGREAWKHLLRPTRSGQRPLRVSLGLPGKLPLPSPEPTIALATGTPWTWVWLMAGALGLMLILGVLLSRTSFDLLRDRSAVDFPTEEPTFKRRRTFSLARCQMLLWTCVVVVCFVYLYIVLNDYNGLLTREALILMGVSSSTTIAASGIEKSREVERSQADDANLRKEWTDLKKEFEGQKDSTEKKKKLMEFETARFGLTEGFFPDLLSDFQGYAIHRMQALLWTVILALIFVQEVSRTLCMPEFNETLLWLLGISNVAYLGFKALEPLPPGVVKDKPTPSTTTPG